MQDANHQRIVLEVLSLPTAPFAEHAVLDYVAAFCRRRDLRAASDAAGNLLVHYKVGKPLRHPVCLTAHLDHPGFVADRMIGPAELQAHWRGGVRADYFAGSRVRFFSAGRWIRGVVETVSRCEDEGVQRVRAATIRVHRPVPPGAVGMWDFPDAVMRNGRVWARGCDDLGGTAALLCCLDDLVRKRAATETYFLFTRAEEVGFVGAIAASRLGTIPKRCLVVAMETSPRLPSARMGDGPILRVGDKSSIFTPAATAYCGRVADALAKRDPSFRYQRKLMDGGTCESSAYCQFGYQATGMCVALGNYHNMDVRRKRIAREYIDAGDLENMIKWFVALCTHDRPYTGRDETLLKRLARLERQHAKLLRQTRPRGAPR